MEENRKGPGVFYAVVGVATLVVAIIGATFAYFSASAQAEKPVTGGTLDLSSNFKVAVTQLQPDTRQASSEKLVPAKFGTSNDALTTTNAVSAVTSALKSKCEEADAKGGYTGCHIWKVTATTGQDLATASLILDISAPKGDNWSYVLFKDSEDLTSLNGTSGTVTLSTSTNAVGKFTAAGTSVDMHNGAPMKAAKGAGVSETYYIMVYLQNTATSQNKDVDETGTYNGTVKFSAASGEVTATFALS